MFCPCHRGVKRESNWSSANCASVDRFSADISQSQRVKSRHGLAPEKSTTHLKSITFIYIFPILCFSGQGSQGLYPEQAQLRFDAWLSGVKQEMEGLLHGVRGSTGEVSALQRSVGDLRQKLGQHQDVRGWIETEFKRLADAIHADDGVMGRLDFVVAMLMEERREGVDTPRYACVLPPWEFTNAHGLSECEQQPEVWVKRLEEWQDDDFKAGKGLFKKKKRLFLVCAHTHRLVPCGTNGQGYDIQQPRTWFKNASSVAAFALQMMFATLGAMLGTPLAVGGVVGEATVSAAMEHVESLLQDQLEGLTFHDRDADMGEAPKVSNKRLSP